MADYTGGESGSTVDTAQVSNRGVLAIANTTICSFLNQLYDTPVIIENA